MQYAKNKSNYFFFLSLLVLLSLSLPYFNESLEKNFSYLRCIPTKRKNFYYSLVRMNTKQFVWEVYNSEKVSMNMRRNNPSSDDSLPKCDHRSDAKEIGSNSNALLVVRGQQHETRVQSTVHR